MLRAGKNGQHILHTHGETIVRELASVDKVELSTRPIQSEHGRGGDPKSVYRPCDLAQFRASKRDLRT
jgi:hypothetical protein